MDHLDRAARYPKSFNMRSNSGENECPVNIPQLNVMDFVNYSKRKSPDANIPKTACSRIIARTTSSEDRAAFNAVRYPQKLPAVANSVMPSYSNDKFLKSQYNGKSDEDHESNIDDILCETESFEKVHKTGDTNSTKSTSAVDACGGNVPTPSAGLLDQIQDSYAHNADQNELCSGRETTSKYYVDVTVTAVNDDSSQNIIQSTALPEMHTLSQECSGTLREDKCAEDVPGRHLLSSSTARPVSCNFNSINISVIKESNTSEQSSRPRKTQSLPDISKMLHLCEEIIQPLPSNIVDLVRLRGSFSHDRDTKQKNLTPTVTVTLRTSVGSNARTNKEVKNKKFKLNKKLRRFTKSLSVTDTQHKDTSLEPRVIVVDDDKNEDADTGNGSGYGENNGSGKIKRPKSEGSGKLLFKRFMFASKRKITKSETNIRKGKQYSRSISNEQYLASQVCSSRDCCG